jgi:hypothetical protein
MKTRVFVDHRVGKNRFFLLFNISLVYNFRMLNPGWWWDPWIVEEHQAAQKQKVGTIVKY